MAPPEETKALSPPATASGGSEAAGAADVAARHPISTVLIIVAMQTEALPIVNRFQLSEDTDGCLFPKGVPWVRYNGKYKDLSINLVWPGKDSILGVDSVGTVSASLVTYASIQALKPDLFINAGTAGGFKAKGASIGDVYLASDVAFHDRRIPIPIFDQYGIGARRTFGTPNLLKELNLKGAAVAYVADLLSVPAIFVKAVTDIIDGEKPTAEEFLQNLVAVTAALDQTVTQVVEFINGRSLSDL